MRSVADLIEISRVCFFALRVSLFKLRLSFLHLVLSHYLASSLSARAVGSHLGAVAAGPELAAAVTNAGGLGVIGGVGYTPDFLRQQVRLEVPSVRVVC